MLTLDRRLKKLLLGSASPRRKEILLAAGFEVEVLPSDVDETQRQGEAPEAYVCRMAEEKALRTLERSGASSALAALPILGADTTVVVDAQTLGKPASAEEARSMLRQLSGREHRVLTGVCILYRMASQEKAGALWKQVKLASTTVRFAALSEGEIDEYALSGEPFDKAGAYAIQGLAAKFVESIQGCYFNVVGLPLALVYRMMKSLESALKADGVTGS